MIKGSGENEGEDEFGGEAAEEELPSEASGHKEIWTRRKVGKEGGKESAEKKKSALHSPDASRTQPRSLDSPSSSATAAA